MKCPETLTLVRHDESAYNALKPLKDKSPLYKEFIQSYDKNPDSDRSYELAIQVKEEFLFEYTDRDTPLADGAGHQSETMGKNLSKRINLPDVIFVSPHNRTISTLEFMTRGWPELKKVKTIQEERIIEQNYGLASLYNDWRVFNILHPEQRDLYKKQGIYLYRYPQGQNIPDLKENINPWIDTLFCDYPEKDVLAVTHHLAILATRSIVEGFDEKEFIRLNQEERPINCGVTIYKNESEGKGNSHLKLDTYNAKLY